MLLNFYYYLIFIPLLLISSLMILFSNSWFSQWMIMEINLISFLSLIMFEKKMKCDIPMNYFLIQSFSSYIFIMFSMNLNLLNSFMNEIYLFILILCMLIKMGMPPFYIWYINIMKNLSWMNIYILMLIQKFIPLFIFSNLIMFNTIYLMNFNLLNLWMVSFICAMVGLQSMNLKILMAYSSIIQMNWIILMMYINEYMSINYMLIYSLNSLVLLMMFSKFNLNYLYNFIMLKFQYNWFYLMYMLMFMSLAGIPPFLGFLMKWISIQSMYLEFNFFMLLLLIFNSLISIYFYTRFMYMSFLNMSLSLKFNMLLINYNLKINFYLIFFIWLILIMLLIYEIF